MLECSKLVSRWEICFIMISKCIELAADREMCDRNIFIINNMKIGRNCLIVNVETHARPDNCNT